MSLPFTRDEFFQVFATYNEACWPYVLALWAVTALATLSFAVWNAYSTRRFLTVLLVFHWSWAAIVYHFAFFSTINPAAWLFGSLFLFEAGLIARHGVIVAPLHPIQRSSTRNFLSGCLIVYALLYPAIGWAEGHEFPFLATFGIPCPTTILTIGVLLSNPSPPRAVTFIPLLWAFIGGSAAFLLDVTADWILIAAGLTLLLYTIGSWQHDNPRDLLKRRRTLSTAERGK